MLVRWMIRRALRDVPVWVQVVGVAALLAYIGWYSFLRMPTGGTLQSHSYIDRSIYSYWVNDNWGGNLGPFGGKTSCCWSFEGDTAEVVWIYGRTVEEFERGDKQERHRMTLPMPERTREDRYLHVHFLPDDQVELVWSPSFSSPLADQMVREYPKDD
ncbi:DUF3304 domain-containing protein [Halomonas koreensis]|uniref:DUF3304 domain-containing protein n=1 Tax=Halomonas koreensis TaxID=245385 RepID=A0ABU1G7E9_9GAMM|nr:DUF3304 domain-containing protein [Halomonas koreensis]MDR5868437.1 DUF3304 domain-containing protein [Halomonas koreensis]